MIYIFDSNDAIQYGVSEAIMIQCFRYWIAKNKANHKHYYDGRYWTYNSIDAFARLFPFWSKDQIRRILESLIQQNVLLKGNFNKTPYDRTKWYAFVNEEAFLTNLHGENSSHSHRAPGEQMEEAFSTDPSAENTNSIWQKCQMELAKNQNEISENPKPIPNILPNILPDKLPDILPGTPPISPPKGGDRSATKKLRSRKSLKASKEKTDTENAAVKDFLARYCESFKALYGQNPIITPKDAGIAKRLIKIPNIDELMERFFAANDKFIVNNRHSLNIIESQLNKLAAPELKYRGAKEWLAEKMAAQEQQEATDADVPSIGTPQFPVA